MDQFLQSSEWSRFQEANGRESVCLAGGAFGFVHVLPVVGKYLYTPRFPGHGVLDLKTVIGEMCVLAQKMQFGWIRIEPETEAVLESWKQQILLCANTDELGFKKAPHDMQPRETFVVDVTKSPAELLAHMKAKTRYNVHLAEKKGVRVFMTREKRYQEMFVSLIEATATRQHILPHAKGYYRKMFESFSENQVALFVAEYEGEVLAANLVSFFGDTATYLHGGTSDVHREVMAPALLQWEQIQEAKRRGCLWYDFGGVSTLTSCDTQSLALSAWKGITRFKLGFAHGTTPIIFPGCYDMVIDQKRYALYLHLRFLQQSFSAMRKFVGR